jgi:hypothetical protein
MAAVLAWKCPMNLRELNEAADRHPFRWGVGSGIGLGVMFGVLWQTVAGGVRVGLGMFVIQVAGFLVKSLIRRRA